MAGVKLNLTFADSADGEGRKSVKYSLFRDHDEGVARIMLGVISKMTEKEGIVRRDFKRRLTAAVISLSLATGMAGVGATAAYAGNSGSLPKKCSLSAATPKLKAVGKKKIKKVYYKGSGTCASKKNGGVWQLRVKLTRQIDYLPNLTLAEKADSTPPKFSKAGTYCTGKKKMKLYDKAVFLWNDDEYHRTTVRESKVVSLKPKC